MAIALPVLLLVHVLLAAVLGLAAAARSTPPSPLEAGGAPWPFGFIAAGGESPSEVVLRELRALEEAARSSMPAGVEGKMRVVSERIFSKILGEIGALRSEVAEKSEMVDALLGVPLDAKQAAAEARKLRDAMVSYQGEVANNAAATGYALYELFLGRADPRQPPGEEVEKEVDESGQRRRQLLTEPASAAVDERGVFFPWWFFFTYDPPPYTFALLYFLGPAFWFASFPFLFASLFLNASGLALFL